MEASHHDALITDRNLAERRLVADRSGRSRHTEARQRRKPYPTRAEDLNLYRRTQEILGRPI